MDINKSLVATTKLGCQECREFDCGREISLEYYLVESDRSERGNFFNNKYGIEIVKTELKNTEEISKESDTVKDLSINKKEVEELLEKLIRCRVTPIALKNILEDFRVTN